MRPGVIGVMGAMREEVEALEPMLSGREVVERAGRRYVRGRVGRREVVVVFSRWGKVAAASTATELIVGHGVERIVFSGVAGALADDLPVGDVVVARRLFQHDLDASPFFRPMEVPLLGVVGIEADETMSGELEQSARGFVEGGGAAGVWRGIGREISPRVVRGDVASGDRVIASVEERRGVAGRVPTAVCVEMEGAAVGQVCFEHGVPFACVRMISDGADEGVEESLGVVLGGVAGAYTAGIVGGWLKL